MNAMPDTPQTEDDEVDASRAPLIDHLIELRSRLIRALSVVIVAFAVLFFFANDIFNILLWPYEYAAQGKDVELIYTAPQEYLLTQIKLALFGAVFIGFPAIAVQIYKFVAPGLYRNEKAAFRPYLVATPILFYLGAAFVYFIAMPPIMGFFLGMEQAGGAGQAAIRLTARTSEYLSLIMTLILAFGIMFQLPVVLTLLARIGVIDSAWLKEKRKYAVVAIFALAAVLTPPDLISQFLLAVPTLLLYEGTIFVVRLTEKKQAAADAAAGVE